MSRFTLFIDASAKAKEEGSSPTESMAYAKSSRFCGEMCHIAALYSYGLSEPLRDEVSLNDHYPFSGRIRSAFKEAWRTECLLIREEVTHFTVYVKWFKKGKKFCFDSCRMRVQDDGTKFISMLELGPK